MNLDHPIRAVRAPLATPATNARASTHGLLPARRMAALSRRDENRTGDLPGSSVWRGRRVVPDVDDALPVSPLLLAPDRHRFPLDRIRSAVGAGEGHSIRASPIGEVTASRHDD